MHRHCFPPLLLPSRSPSPSACPPAVSPCSSSVTIHNWIAPSDAKTHEIRIRAHGSCVGRQSQTEGSGWLPPRRAMNGMVGKESPVTKNGALIKHRGANGMCVVVRMASAVGQRVVSEQRSASRRRGGTRGQNRRLWSLPKQSMGFESMPSRECMHETLGQRGRRERACRSAAWEEGASTGAA